MMRFILILIALCFTFTSCTMLLIDYSNDSSSKKDVGNVTIPEDYKERVTPKHVNLYVGSEAEGICKSLGKINQNRNHNYHNSYDFNVYSKENITRAELICKHRYTKQVGIYTQEDRSLETKPVVYLMDEKYDSKEQYLSSLNLIGKEILLEY